jgi:DNA polymerase-3 subunit alpha
MTSDKDKIEKVVRTIADARALGVTVLPPDINESDTDFKVVYTHPKGDRRTPRSAKVRDVCGPQIRFGLGAVRGVGGSALETLFEARAAGGSFVDLFDFASRVDAKKINKSVLEALVQCGAFDSTLAAEGVTRSSAFASIDIALDRSRAASRDREVGQTNLFGLFDAAPKKAGAGGTSQGDYVVAPTWDRREMLVREKQSLGFYVSGHPLDRYSRGGTALQRLDVKPVADCAGMADWSVVRLAGMVEGYREKVLREGGGKLAFFELEDLTGRVNVKLRGALIETHAAVLAKGDPVVITGKVSFPRRDEDAPAEEEGDAAREATILLNDVQPLADAVRAGTKGMTIRLPAATTTVDQLEKMRDVLAAWKGICPVTLELARSNADAAAASFPLPAL